MINKLNLRILRNAEFLQFLKLTIKAVVDNDVDQLKVRAAITALETEYNASDALFILPQNSKLTTEIVASDNRRDDVIAGISKIISGYLNDWELNYVDAAKELSAHIKLYGTEIYSFNYQAQSSVISSMTKDWSENTTLASALTLLGLDRWKDELVRSNDNFINVYSNRTKELGSKNTDNFKLRRAEGITAYDKLITLLSAHATIDQTGMYTPVMNELNALVEQYNILLAARKSNSKRESLSQDSET